MNRIIYYINYMLSCMVALSVYGQKNSYSMIDGSPEWIYYCQAHKNVLTDPSMYFDYKQSCFMRVYVGESYEMNKEIRMLQCEFYDLDGKLINPSHIVPKSSQQYPFLLGVMREDNGVVYGAVYAFEHRYTNYYNKFDLKKYGDNLLLDFNLEKEDTLFVVDGQLLEYHVIDKQNVILADGSNRNIMTFSCYSRNYNTYQLIEGIGFINAPTSPLGELWNSDKSQQTRHWWNLNCFIQNGKVVYIAPREGLENDEEYEGSTRFRDMPFYPDITPESVADGTYVIADDVNNIAGDETAKGKSIYNLQGQRTSRPAKGIHIVDGKKVLVK